MYDLERFETLPPDEQAIRLQQAAYLRKKMTKPADLNMGEITACIRYGEDLMRQSDANPAALNELRSVIELQGWVMALKQEWLRRTMKNMAW